MRRGRTQHFVHDTLPRTVQMYTRYFFESGRKFLQPENGAFQLFGLDFLVTSDFHVYLLEGNGNPGIDMETPWQEAYLMRMTRTKLRLVRQLHERPAEFPARRVGDTVDGFVCIVSDWERYCHGLCAGAGARTAPRSTERHACMHARAVGRSEYVRTHRAPGRLRSVPVAVAVRMGGRRPAAERGGARRGGQAGGHDEPVRPTASIAPRSTTAPAYPMPLESAP